MFREEVLGQVGHGEVMGERHRRQTSSR